MDGLNLQEKAAVFLKKYRYVILVVLVGLILMAIPESKPQEEKTVPTVPAESDNIQTQLEEILAQIQGVGRVEVLLTISSGERTVYEYDQDLQEDGDSASLRTETVIITDGDRAERGLVRQVIPPVYLGAVIVCQGGDLPGVKLAVVEAVSAVTGLTADKISVLKMK